MVFYCNEPDYQLSPYTGMVRKHWVEAALIFLNGVFSHVSGPTAPLIFPRSQNDGAYPAAGEAEWRYASERFEGVARTFTVAAPLIRENPVLNVRGYNLKDYYALQILNGTRPDSPHGFRTLAEIVKQTGEERPFQQICESALLTVTLFITKEQIWDQYSHAERDQIARFLSDFGHARTNAHNWRWFNILILTFLKINGYSINEQVLQDHLQNIFTYYAGDGWYRDGDLFDYYSPWAFQYYGPIWCSWYGYRYEPEMAAVIEANFNTLMKHYARFFDREGHSIMWGRSNIYRSCASAPFAAGFFLKNHTPDPGLARRILSGNLAQFITKEEMFVNNLPSLGYYGPFQPMVQPYSCVASPFWLGKSFIALYFGEDAPLWKAVEINGIWEGLGTSTDRIEIPGPGITITNYGQSGATEIKTAKYLLDPEKKSYLPAYSRLAFHSAFPWEARDGRGPEAMSYTLKYLDAQDGYLFPNICLYGGIEGDVLYRRIYFNFQHALRDPLIDLAELEIAHGIIRVDRPRIPRKPYHLFLGHYGLPHVDESITTSQKTIDGKNIYFAKTHSLQTVLITYHGWDDGGHVTRLGVNAISTESTLLFASSEKSQMYGGIDLLITILLHRCDGKEWTDSELTPIVSCRYLEIAPSGAPLGVELLLRDGRKTVIDFHNAEGRLGI